LNLLIIDDHPLTRFGLQAALGSMLPGSQIAAAGSVEDALATLNRPPRPDVILLDLRLPTLADGIGLLRQLRVIASTAAVLVVSGEDSPDLVAMLKAEGARGFVSKSEGPDQLVAAIRQALATPAGFRASDSVSASAGGGPPCPPLIPRVWQVYALVASGKPNKVIARELDISEGAVKNYVTRILDATATSNRGEAIVLYAENIERWRLDPTYRGGAPG
jgi:two-component system, NarL family, nitrate/nitrite response regulator NarL